MKRKIPMRKRVEQLKQNLKSNFECFSMEMQVWWQNNREWAVVIIPVAAGVTVKLINETGKVVKSIANAKAADITAKTVWDPSLQVHYTLKHKMNDRELNEYVRLTNSGLKMSEALRVLNLI